MVDDPIVVAKRQEKIIGKKETAEEIHRVMRMSKGELEHKLMQPQYSVFTSIIQSVATMAIKGHTPSINFLFDRLCGKITDKIELSSNSTEQKLTIISKKLSEGQ
jgi:phosphohistidine phosphatase SixA